MSKNETVFLDYEDALNLVERISERCKNFDYEMSESEQRAMAQLLSDIGVKVSDLISVDYLADNYAINAEIVRGDKEAKSYDRSTLNDALFSWQENDETFYCIQW